MAATAVSVVQRSNKPAERVSLLGLHVLAGGIGGGLVGGAIGFAGQRFVDQGTWPIVAGGVALAGLWDVARGRMRWIQPPHGVPPEWLAWQPRSFLAAYGLVLGAGIFTPYTAAATYALVGLMLLIGQPWLGVAVMGTYGALRAFVSVLAAITSLGSDLGTVTTRLQRTKERWRPYLGAIALAASLTALIVRP